MAVRLVICNRKGGTGKTTVSVNLAAGLANTGLKVLLLDLDSQGHCSSGLGIKARDNFIHDIFYKNDANFVASLRRTDIPNLWLCPADPNFDHSQGRLDPHRLSHVIESSGVDDAFDIIIMDTPPSLDMLLRNALLAARWVIVPFVPHYLSYEGVKQLVKLMYDIKKTENPDLQLKGFLPTMASQTKRHHRKIMNDVASHFGAQRMLPPIRCDIRLVDAFATGEPIQIFDPGSRGANDFGALCERLTSDFKTPA
ncbi:MAG: ParA family protein [Thalassolituus sp.]